MAKKKKTIDRRVFKKEGEELQQWLKVASDTIVRSSRKGNNHGNH